MKCVVFHCRRIARDQVCQKKRISLRLHCPFSDISPPLHRSSLTSNRLPVAFLCLSTACPHPLAGCSLPAPLPEQLVSYQLMEELCAAKTIGAAKAVLQQCARCEDTASL